MVQFYKKLPNCFTEQLYHFTFLLGTYERSSFSTFSPAFADVTIFLCSDRYVVTSFFIFILFFFLAASGLHCGARASLQLWRVGFLSLIVARGLQGMWVLQLCTGSRARGLCSLRHAGSLVEMRELSSWRRTDLVAPRHVGSQFPDQGSNPTRDRTRVPCIGRQILYHWTTREVPVVTSYCGFNWYFPYGY